MSYRLMDGWVTTYRSVSGRSPLDLARAIGYSSNAFHHGYMIYELVDLVSRGEYDWGGRTTHSGFWQKVNSNSIAPAPGIDVNDIWVPAVALRRDRMHEKYNDNDHRFDEFMKRDLRRMNIRSGPDRIVKVTHPPQDGMKYPPAPWGNSMPQWRLRTKKRFRLLVDNVRR